VLTSTHGGESLYCYMLDTFPTHKTSFRLGTDIGLINDMWVKSHGQAAADLEIVALRQCYGNYMRVTERQQLLRL
jgi:hypothetical protein